MTTSIVPGLTQVTQNVQGGAERGDFRYPWQNLVDLRVREVVHASATPGFEPTLDLFNLFNNNAVTNAVTTVGSLARPSVGDRDGQAGADRRANQLLTLEGTGDYGSRDWGLGTSSD